MSDIYYDSKHPSSFSGINKLYAVVKSQGISRLNVQKWLKKQETHNLFVRPRLKFKRSRVIVAGYQDQWDVDLLDMASYASNNDGTTFLLVTIDIFSRQAHVIPLKNKRGQTVADALQKLFKDEKPNIMRSDGGMEFNCNAVREILAEYKVKGWIAYNDSKANYAERLILTLKRRIYKYMQYKNTFKYLDVLQDIVHSYNNTYHRSLQRTPASVNKGNEDNVRLEQYLIRKSSVKNKKNLPKSYMFNIGDTVRVSHARKAFERGYLQSWSTEIFKISKRYKRGTIPVYDITDWDDEPIYGSFYSEQLQAVTVDSDRMYKIESVIKRRTLNKRPQSFVKWQGWPDKFNSWINTSSVKDYLP